MNIEQHQTLARDVSPSTPRINGLYSVCSVCQAADVKWVGKRGNQIGFVVRLICIFDIAPDDRTEIGEKSASAAARGRVIEIESSLTQIRRRARFGAEIGFLTALEESASLPLSLSSAGKRQIRCRMVKRAHFSREWGSLAPTWKSCLLARVAWLVPSKSF